MVRRSISSSPIASAASGSWAPCSWITTCRATSGSRLEYIGADNQPHGPVMIHRAPLGSLERFVGVLIEHFAGAFPLWLAPEQVRVLTVSEKGGRHMAASVERAIAQPASAPRAIIGRKRWGRKSATPSSELIPYMFVVGEREAAGGHRRDPRPHRRRPGGHAARGGDRKAQGRGRRQDKSARSPSPTAGLAERGEANEY